ncbi:hypothetical protein M5D96_004948, partial [Drosophila gunungcola]
MKVLMTAHTRNSLKKKDRATKNLGELEIGFVLNRGKSGIESPSTQAKTKFWSI